LICNRVHITGIAHSISHFDEIYEEQKFESCCFQVSDFVPLCNVTPGLLISRELNFFINIPGNTCRRFISCSAVVIEVYNVVGFGFVDHYYLPAQVLLRKSDRKDTLVCTYLYWFWVYYQFYIPIMLHFTHFKRFLVLSNIICAPSDNYIVPFPWLKMNLKSVVATQR
jgi:hypothetical protein